MQKNNKQANNNTTDNDNIIGKVYHRPWGTYQTLELKQKYQVKILTVNASGRLSLQKHQQRSEHWVVVAGKPTITIGEISKTYTLNDRVYIPVGVAHRIENFTTEPVVIVEIQIGDYLGEDDIIRLDDVYGRTKD